MGTVARQRHLQWKIPLTPRLTDGDNSSGQEKCALRYVNKRKAEKIKRGKNYVNIYKTLSFLDSISKGRYVDMKSIWGIFCFT